MKTLSILSLALLSTSTFAADVMSLSSYCRSATENRELSRVALQNEGRADIEDIVSGQKKSEYYRGCRFDTPWMDQMYQALCADGKAVSLNEAKSLANNLSSPQAILFFFDGAADFNANMANRSVRPVNIDGSEGSDLGAGNGNGLRGLSQMFSSSSHALRKNSSKIELHYHSGSGFKQRENYASALACAKETKQNLDVLNSLKDIKTQPKWLVMGYSNGGALTIDFQHDVTKFDVAIDLAVAIDPIVQTAIYTFHKLKSTIGSKDEKTKRFVNYYQDTDKYSLPGFELRGKPVKDADVNFLLTSENSGLSADGSYNHVKIPSDSVVFQKTSCEFGAVFGSKNKCD